MKMFLSRIAQAVRGEVFGKDKEIAGVSIDTRSMEAGQLYVALKGRNFDGHAFIDKAEQANASAVLVEGRVATGLPQIVVKDSRLALAELAGYWRQQLPVKIVGVTGSNGKTTVKEMIAAILAIKGNTLFTKGNLNNDIGVPLTLLKLDHNHRYAVIEMGANHLGEIAYSSRYVAADVGVLTNAGPAHIEGFGSMQGVARGKGEIIESLSHEGVAVLNLDDEFYPLWRQLAGERRITSFGMSAEADVRAEKISTVLESNGFVTRFELKVMAESLAVKLNLAGEHNVKNALAATSAALQFGADLQEIKLGLEQLKPVAGRMQPLLGRKGNTVIDDTYNANPASLKAALETLNVNEDNWLILGDFGELGVDSQAIHRELGRLIKSMPVKRIYATGKLAKQTVEAFGDGGQFFDDQEQLIAALDMAITGNEVLLVKGSRAQKMENVVAAMVDNFRAA